MQSDTMFNVQAIDGNMYSDSVFNVLVRDNNMWSKDNKKCSTESMHMCN